jgi:hypothetical protein
LSVSRRRLWLAMLTTLGTVVVAVACNLTDGLTGGLPDADSSVTDSARSDGGAYGCDLAACPSGPNSAPFCVDGGCGLLCTAPFADCDRDAGDGCEVDLAGDPVNCGACGHSCQGGACSNGGCQPVTLFSGSNAPAHIAIDSTFIYGVNGDGTVVRLEKEGDGGDTTTVVGTTSNAPQGSPVLPRIAVDSTNIYWTVFSVSKSFYDGGVKDAASDADDGAPKDGGPLDGAPKDAATDSGAAPDSASPGAILTVPLDGGAANLSVLAVTPAPPYAIAALGGSVYWSQGNPNNGDLCSMHSCVAASCSSSELAAPVTPSGRIYGAVAYESQLLFPNAVFNDAGTGTTGQGSIGKCQLPFAQPCATLVQNLGFPYSVATDPVGDAASPPNVYLSIYGAPGTIESCVEGFCTPTATAIDTYQFESRFLTSDGAFVYFTTADGAVKSVPVTGGSERILFQLHGSTPWDIAVDATSIYWTSLANSPVDPQPSLRRLAK